MDNFSKYKELERAERAVSNNTPTAMSTLGNQILVSKYHPPLKGTRLLREMADSSTRAAKG